MLNCKSSNWGGVEAGGHQSANLNVVTFISVGGWGGGFNALGHTGKHWHSLSAQGQSRVFHSIVPRRRISIVFQKLAIEACFFSDC